MKDRIKLFKFRQEDWGTLEDYLSYHGQQSHPWIVNNSYSYRLIWFLGCCWCIAGSFLHAIHVDWSTFKGLHFRFSHVSHNSLLTRWAFLYYLWWRHSRVITLSHSYARNFKYFVIFEVQVVFQIHLYWINNDVYWLCVSHIGEGRTTFFNLTTALVI